MILFLRKTQDKQYPLCVAFLCVANIHIFYVLPFSDESEGAEKDNVQFDTFWEQLSMGSTFGQEYKDSDYSSTERIGSKVEMDLKMGAEATVTMLKKDKTGQWIKADDKGARLKQ